MQSIQILDGALLVACLHIMNLKVLTPFVIELTLKNFPQ